MFRLFVQPVAFVCALGLAGAAVAQSPPAAGTEAALLAEGWARLARGDAAGAAAIASQAVAQRPFSAAALVLAVDSELARGGASAALNTYEKWLGSRKLEDMYALRRVARGVLVESGRNQPNAGARLDALRALASDGDQTALAALEKAAAAASQAEVIPLAASGDERAVNRLIGQLSSVPGSRSRIIGALGESGSRSAIPPLVGMLADANDTNRAAAAEALGRLNATEAIPQLRALLNDQFPGVRLKAAGALYRMNDSSGVTLLTDLAQSEHAMVRVGAAGEMASRPDAAWQSLVRSLADDADPLVRLQAAHLMASFDQAAAATALDQLMRDGNAGIREAASREVAESPFTVDAATLRALLRSGDVAVRVRAAARILEMTR